MTDQEFLMHYGVKGMKWKDKKGTTDETPSSSKKKASKESAYNKIGTGNEQIVTGRGTLKIPELANKARRNAILRKIDMNQKLKRISDEKKKAIIVEVKRRKKKKSFGIIKEVKNPKTNKKQFGVLREVMEPKINRRLFDGRR